MEQNKKTAKQKIQDMYTRFTAFLKKDEQIREKSMNIVEEAVEEEDEKKIQQIKEKINKQ